ncbi:MAG: BrnA antitoxin family protein [Candidatus Omnitrophota bacterium]
MKEKRKNSKTDYKRIDSRKDKDVDYSDIKELDGKFWEKAELVLPHPKVKVTIRLDPQIIVWFKNKGDHYQTRINAVLKSYVNAKKVKAKQH